VNIHTKKVLARIIGNFGIAFFSPLVGGNVAETLFNLSLTFGQTVIIAFFSAIFVSGLSISKEAVEWSKLWNETK
jgi:hypothetical protein|tara:strand:+ start:6244 stop:6468 length:225 start_codon:yes stop_codon:yes gene_type:complete